MSLFATGPETNEEPVDMDALLEKSDDAVNDSGDMDTPDTEDVEEVTGPDTEEQQ